VSDRPTRRREEPHASILVVEDDDPTRREVARNLAGHGYHVVESVDARSALAAWGGQRPDVVLVDLGLPDRSGLTVIRRIRREAATPIIVISARSDEGIKVEALEAGADDYVTKPFGMAELRARIHAVLRRAAGPAVDGEGLVVNGELTLDVAAHRVTVAGKPTALTPREFEILKVLLAHPGRVVTKARLLRAVWGEAYADEGHYVHVYVSQLRHKLAEADQGGTLHDLIQAEPGVGYRVRAG
jgi:two-component system, OmpR family, KDP operon response regulator KdpE